MPVAVTNLLEQLTAIAGAEHVREGQGSLSVAPANTEQVSQVLRFANENGLTVSPVGGDTKRCWGNPSKTEIQLQLTRLNRLIEHPWQDLTCTVQAGCTWAAMQQRLGEHGQFVALDPFFADRATVGGVLATNDSGALRHKYGSLRDLVIGMTIVLADGTIARAGGKVVKNVAGYDLPKLLTGAFGTLGVITEATFRLHALPEHTRSFSISGNSSNELASLMITMRSSHLLMQALQLRSTESETFDLNVALNAHPEAKQDDLLREMVHARGLSMDDASEEIWQARQKVAESGAEIVVKATMLPTDVGPATDLVTRAGGLAVTQAFGIMIAALPSGQVIPQLQQLIAPAGGSITLLNSRSQMSGSVFTESVNTLSLMRAVKQHFDPKHTLNPGRFLGGI